MTVLVNIKCEFSVYMKIVPKELMEADGKSMFQKMNGAQLSKVTWSVMMRIMTKEIKQKCKRSGPLEIFFDQSPLLFYIGNSVVL